METSPRKKISGSLKKLCICLVLVFALGFAALACSDGSQLTDQPQQTSQATSADQSTPDSSLSTDCGPSSPCVGGGSNNSDSTVTQGSGSGKDNRSSPRQVCQPDDPNQPFCVYLDHSQLASQNQIGLSWQASSSSSSYQYTAIQLSFPSRHITKHPINVNGGNALLSQTLPVNTYEFDVIQVEGCVNGNCYGSEPIAINTGYALSQGSINVQPSYAVMLRASPHEHFFSSSLKLEQSAPCAHFCRLHGDLQNATYYISKPTVQKISQILGGYKVATTFIKVLQSVLPDLVASLECAPCGVAAAALTIIATILGFYIDAFQTVLNTHSSSQGVTFDVQYGVFLKKSSIQAVS